jgi:hypothetical protein
MAISIPICNMALGELRAGSITDINEDSVEAGKCALYYPQALKLLLERYEWSFATRIATLALLTDNPRASEWTFAYGLPTDLATPKRLVPPGTQTQSSALSPPYPVIGQPYIVEAGILYTHTPGAILEYSTNDLDESVMSGMFIEALAASLAAKLAVPLRDSTQLKGQLLQQAEVEAQRAIADDANRQPQHQDWGEDEVGMVRAGYGSC